MEPDENPQPSPEIHSSPNHAELERELTRIWCEVLNQESIGLRDDFLGLGGDSMSAMRCINRISTAFGVELPVDIFLVQSASISEIADAIANSPSDIPSIPAPDGA